MNTSEQHYTSIKLARKCLAHLRTISSPRRHAPCEDELDTSDPFLRDQIKLLCSKATRRLGDKTQVVSFPVNRYIRDRSVHTKEVVACAIRVSDILGLNVGLACAAAEGHDIGHVPFGHQGERFLSERFSRPFTHEVMGVVVAQHIERSGHGLNLTFACLDAMHKHGGNLVPSTPEGMVVKISDKIAYVFSDYNDFLRMDYPIPSHLRESMEWFGNNQRTRVLKAITALCVESQEKGRVEFSDSEEAKRFANLKKLMYQIYPKITQQDPRRILEPICDFLEVIAIADPCLVLALMTDKDVVYLSNQSMLNISHLQHTSVWELMDIIRNKHIDVYNPDLGWGVTV